MFTVLLKVIFIFCVFLPLQDVLFTSKLTMHGIHLVKEEDYIWYNDSVYLIFFFLFFKGVTTITKLLMRHWAKQYNCGFKICSVFYIFFYLQRIDFIFPSPSLNSPPPFLSLALSLNTALAYIAKYNLYDVLLILLFSMLLQCLRHLW